MALPSKRLAQYEKFQELTNGTVRYYEMGSGDNVTLLLHGMGVVTSADTYQFVIEDLAKHLKVYALDYLGFGKSTRKMDYGPTFDVIVDGIREFMDVKGLKKVNLVGHSAGGWFGGILAYESPDRINKCVFIGTAGLNKTPSPGVSGYAPPQLERLMQNCKNSVFEGSALTVELAEEMARQQYAYGTMEGAFEGMKPLVQQMQDPASRKQYMLHRRMPFVKAPILYMWGKGDTMDPLPTWTAEYEQCGGDMRKSSKPWGAPNSKYILTPGGHNSHWEAPQLVVKHVVEFLTR